jgi:hypothetical protein
MAIAPPEIAIAAPACPALLSSHTMVRETTPRGVATWP